MAGHCTTRPRVRRACVTAAFASAVAALMAMAPMALAESATSPTGSVSVSVPPPVLAGVAATYTLKFTNTTAATLTGIVAQGNLPSGMALKNINGCARLGGNQSLGFLCTMPNLAAGASEVAAFNLVASGIGSYDVPLTVTGAEPVAGSPGTLQVVGDSVTLPVNVQPAPTDIQVTGSSSTGSPAVGGTFSYTFQVKNDGPLPAFGVTFDDALPPGLALGGTVTTTGGACTASVPANAVHCDVGSLGVGEQTTISLSATPATTGLLTNSATVAMTAADTHPANNTVAITVQPK